MRLLGPFFFFFNDTATTEIYTLSLHDALPILQNDPLKAQHVVPFTQLATDMAAGALPNYGFIEPNLCNDADRKSTRLNSSHGYISYAVFCLKKKKKNTTKHRRHTMLRPKRDNL